MKIRTFLFVAFVLLYDVSARAQQDSAARLVRYGVFGSAGVNFHKAPYIDSRQIVSMAFYGLYSPARGVRTEKNFGAMAFGWSSGALIELPLLNEFGMSFRFSYAKIGGLLTAPYESSPLMEQYFDTSPLAQLGTEAYLTFRLLDRFVLYAGVQLATIMNTPIEGGVRILDTNRYSVFSNGQKMRYEFTGSFNTFNNPNLGLSAGACYEIPIDNSKQWFCALELFYTYFLGSIIPEPSIWALTTLRAGVSLRYAPFATGK